VAETDVPLLVDELCFELLLLLLLLLLLPCDKEVVVFK
jgi:hypothetical protein